MIDSQKKELCETVGCRSSVRYRIAGVSWFFSWGALLLWRTYAHVLSYQNEIAQRRFHSRALNAFSSFSRLFCALPGTGTGSAAGQLHARGHTH